MPRSSFCRARSTGWRTPNAEKPALRRPFSQILRTSLVAALKTPLLPRSDVVGVVTRIIGGVVGRDRAVVARRRIDRRRSHIGRFVGVAIIAVARAIVAVTRPVIGAVRRSARNR